MAVSKSVVARHVIVSVKAGVLLIKRQLDKYPVCELAATIIAVVTETLQ